MIPSNYKLYIAEHEIQKKVQSLATKIQAHYDHVQRDSKTIHTQNLCAIIVLGGAIFFATDLLRNITLPMKIEFIKAKSYENNKSTSKVLFEHGKDFFEKISNHHILIIEDIIDSGLTLRSIQKYINENANPLSIQTVCLLSKPDLHTKEDEANFVGFEISNDYVVGYGLDNNQLDRNLREIYQVIIT